jgi:uncharacterized Zn finger protein
MTKTRKRTEITLERSELSVIRRSVQRVVAWCDQCGEVVRMVTPDEARAVAGLSARQIYRWVECGRVHFREAPDGRVSICLKSLY